MRLEFDIDFLGTRAGERISGLAPLLAGAAATDQDLAYLGGLFIRCTLAGAAFQRALDGVLGGEPDDIPVMEVPEDLPTLEIWGHTFKACRYWIPHQNCITRSLVTPQEIRMLKEVDTWLVPPKRGGFKAIWGTPAWMPKVVCRECGDVIGSDHRHFLPVCEKCLIEIAEKQISKQVQDPPAPFSRN